MKHLSYKNQNHHNQLFVENIAIADIAAKVGTPFYCYSKQTLVENFQSFVDAFSHAEITDYKICYAIKANFNIHLVKILSELGAGIDAVSAGEVFRGIKAKVNPKKIVFAGVGKTRQEMEYALNPNPSLEKNPHKKSFNFSLFLRPISFFTKVQKLS
jgi:diaminopimelate decarboxylase